MRQKAVVLLLVGVLAVVLLSASFWVWSGPGRRYGRGYEQVERGMSVSQIQELMGPPDQVRTKDDMLPSWNTGGRPENGAPCVLEYRYVVPTWYLPFVWIVGFDKDGRVVGKHQL